MTTAHSAKKCLAAMVGGAIVLGTGLALDCETTRNSAEYFINPLYVKSAADKSYLLEAAGLTAIIAAPFALAYKALMNSEEKQQNRDENGTI
ncbi:hypothetical protein GF343_05255 [Candidatus Woesearchaeota archaeon]|nr:hypothetical protein [Candidatus Woesearchaeota archaeon]